MRRLLVAACVLIATDVALAADAYLPEPQVISPPLFAGFYLGAGGGYGLSVSRHYQMSAFGLTFGNSPTTSGDVVPQGWLGTSVAGYNIQHGAFLAGLEVSGRWGKEIGDGKPFSRNIAEFAGESDRAEMAYRFRSNTGFHVAGRVGVVFDRTLVFAKAGIGAAHAEDHFSFNGSGQICTAIRFINNQIVCDATAPLGSTSINIVRWSPAIVVGVGIEHNLGRFFVRAGADIEGITGLKGFVSGSEPITPFGTFTGSASSEAFWTTRGTALVGFRF